MDLREEFKKETGLRTIVEDGMGNSFYTEDYVEWLEDRVKKLSISDVRSSKINESNSSINIKYMTIKYNPIDEEDGVYLGGGDYTLELHTNKGIFYHKVKKRGELEDDGPDM